MTGQHRAITAVRNLPGELHLERKGLWTSIDLRNPFTFVSTQNGVSIHGLKSSRRNHQQRWASTTRHFEKLFRSVPLSVVSFFGSSRCFRCRSELELAKGCRVTSHRGIAAVHADDVHVYGTRNRMIKRRCRTNQIRSNRYCPCGAMTRFPNSPTTKGVERLKPA